VTLITRLALRRPLTVYVLMAIIAIGGLASYLALPRESFPEIKVPLIIVSAPYPGTAPADMENQVTRKIELELKGISGVKEIRSTSADGYSVIEVEFNPDVDLDDARQKVREAVDRARPELPEDLDEPAVTDIDFSRVPIMIATLAGQLGMDRLKDIADDIKDDLEGIPGVNQVQIVGGREREVHVYADPRRLTAFDLGLTDLVDTVAREHLTIPGGDVDIGRLNYLVRVPAEVSDPLEISDFVVADRDGRPVRIDDVATVLYGYEEEETRARLDGRKAISLTVEKRTGANIIEVAREIRASLAHFEQTLPGTATIEVVTDQSEDIEDMVLELENNILSGLALVLVVLFVALGWRPAVIVSAAIPFSMMISFLILSSFGVTLNMVVLFSLILVLGMLVDNAVVTVENIYRHRELGDDPRISASAGTTEVAMPITTSTLTTLSAFAPLLLWPGIVGEFMKFLPMTLIIGLSASLFVALVFNPTLAFKMFGKPVRPRRQSGAYAWMVRVYRGLLEASLDPGPRVWGWRLRNWSMIGVFALSIGAAVLISLTAMLLGAQPPGTVLMTLAGIGVTAFALQGVLWLLSVPGLVIGMRGWVTDRRSGVLYVAITVLAGTVALYGVLGKGVEFFPEIDPREIWIDLEFPPGTTVEAQDDLVREVERRVGDLPDIDSRVANVASTGVDQFGAAGGGSSNVSRVTLKMLDYYERSQSSMKTMGSARRELADLTGAQVKVDRPEEGPPTGKPVSIRLIGEDYSALSRVSRELMGRLDQIEGLYNVDQDYDAGFPEIQVRVDRAKAARANLDTRQIGLAVRTALAGTEVAKYRTGEDEYEIVVRLPPSQRRSVDRLEELTIPDEDGRPIPLSTVAKIDRSAGPSAIRRVDLDRVITVDADVDHDAGYSDNEMRSLAARELEEMQLPAGVRWEFGGSNEEEQESQAFLSRAFVIALLVIALILVTQFDSLVTPITILLSVALSLIGVFWGLMITGQRFGIIMTGIGVISLAGIVVNNAIVLCDFIVQERAAGASRREAIIAGGVTRMRPVLLTAVTTILGLIPLTAGISLDVTTLEWKIGGESTAWWGPMGVAVIFGLAVATVLTLIVVPVTYDVLAGLGERNADERQEAGPSRTG
jgi:multidrug efflux pump subunit AcrB